MERPPGVPRDPSNATPTGDSDRYLVALVVIMILLLSLAPTPPWPGSKDRWFEILGGPDSWRDGILNIVLYLPLGVVLAARRWSTTKVGIAGATLSFVVECAQFVVPGRAPSVRDCLANTIGVILGALLWREAILPRGGQAVWAYLAEVPRRLATPERRGAGRLSLLWAAMLAALVGSAGWLGAADQPQEPIVFGSSEFDVVPGPLRIGRGADAGTSFRGVLDDVLVWKTARAGTEILSDMAGTASMLDNPDLVGAWFFDEREGDRVRDATSHHNDGVVTRAQRVAGRRGGALRFDDPDACVLVPANPSLDLSEGMTLEAWVLPGAQTDPWPALIEKSQESYFLYAGAFGSADHPNAGGTFGGLNEGVSSIAPLPCGRWSHVAATYDGSALRVFVDGQEAARWTRWFGRRVGVASIGASTLTPGPVRDPESFFQWLKEGKPLVVRGVTGPATPDAAPIIKVETRGHATVLSVVAYGEDVRVALRNKARWWGLPSPTSVAPGALSGLRDGDPFEIAIRPRGDVPSLRVGGATFRLRGPTLASTWGYLLHDELIPPGASRTLDFVWIAGLVLPLGLWWRPTASCVGALALVVLILGPGSIAAGLQPVTALQTGGALTGLTAGVLASRSSRNQGSLISRK